MTLPEDLDAAIARLHELSSEYADALSDMDREHAAGRTGLAAYRRAAALYDEVKQSAAILADRIDEARRSL